MLSSRSFPQVGDLIDGKYRIVRSLGAGGMGVVFHAINVGTDGSVALKFLSPELASTPEAMERLRREARATGRINHPNVVAVHDCGSHGRQLYIVMELLEGAPLSSWLANRRIEPAAACAILFPVMRGVAAAHEAGVLHRDIKPDNVFLAHSRDGLDPVPKVLDFGIAKLSVGGAHDSQLSVAGTIMGTYQYMAPEQLRGREELDARADIYALGVLFFNMLTARLPYLADNPVDLALQIVASEAPPVTAYVPTLSPGLAQVVARAMARDRTRRFSSVDELATALEPFSGGLMFRGVGRRSAQPRERPPPGRSVTEQLNMHALAGSVRPVQPLQTPFAPSMVSRFDPPVVTSHLPPQRSSTPAAANVSISQRSILLAALILSVSGVGIAAYVKSSRDQSAPVLIDRHAPQEPAAAAPSPPSIDTRGILAPAPSQPGATPLRAAPAASPPPPATPARQPETARPTPPSSDFELPSDWGSTDPSSNTWPSPQAPSRARSERRHARAAEEPAQEVATEVPRTRQEPRVSETRRSAPASSERVRGNDWGGSEPPSQAAEPQPPQPAQPAAAPGRSGARGRAGSELKFDDF